MEIKVPFFDMETGGNVDQAGACMVGQVWNLESDF